MSKLTPPVNPGDHVLGDPAAPVSLVEYGDYECPYCGRAQLVVKEVLRQVGPEVLFVFRHFPLAELHPHALIAAEAAEAAGAQGQFWPMHAMLFANQRALEPADLLGYAKSLGLETPRFVRELAAHTHRDKVRADFRSGVRSDVHGTPTFFVDGVQHDADWDAATLLAALRAALRAKAA
jgi:protein-disulfide isomerase